jgi:hypothetical protein
MSKDQFARIAYEHRVSQVAVLRGLPFLLLLTVPIDIGATIGIDADQNLYRLRSRNVHDRRVPAERGAGRFA